MVRVLALEPKRARARLIARALPLRDDAFEPELAGVLEDGPAVDRSIIDPIVMPQPGTRRREQARKIGLSAFDRVAPQIVAVQLDQVA